ncbi:MAG: type II secretion system protein [Proteobacteria bacterium]|nr:type II secretion system protein [Pseudomonadota bacterium]
MNKLTVHSLRFTVPGATPNRKQFLSGFTIIEMVMVIVITGIIGSMVAVFLKWPVQQYIDLARRAELTDIADTAFFHLAGDISTAVPNSVRVAGCGTTPCIEFLPTRDVGRYRALTDQTIPASAVGDILDFTLADSSFDVIGTPVNFAAGDYIVVGNTQSDGAPAYDTTAALGVLRAYAGAAGLQSKVTITPTQFPAFAQLATQRFDVVDGTLQAVTYACEGTLGTLDANKNGQASLVKHWGYGFNKVQAAPASLAGSRAVLADKVSGCVIDYAVANQRLGLLGVRLTLTSGGESVSLYQEIHVSNAP